MTLEDRYIDYATQLRHLEKEQKALKFRIATVSREMSKLASTKGFDFRRVKEDQAKLRGLYE